MTRFRAHFDGSVLVPDQPIELPVGCELDVSAVIVERTEHESTALKRLAALADQFPGNPDLPTDGAAQHDHYLFGTPKRG